MCHGLYIISVFMIIYIWYINLPPQVYHKSMCACEGLRKHILWSSFRCPQVCQWGRSPRDRVRIKTNWTHGSCTKKGYPWTWVLWNPAHGLTKCPKDKEFVPTTFVKTCSWDLFMRKWLKTNPTQIRDFAQITQEWHPCFNWKIDMCRCVCHRHSEKRSTWVDCCE